MRTTRSKSKHTLGHLVSQLPTDVLVEILSYLPRESRINCLTVNKQWLTASLQCVFRQELRVDVVLRPNSLVHLLPADLRILRDPTVQALLSRLSILPGSEGPEASFSNVSNFEERGQRTPRPEQRGAGGAHAAAAAAGDPDTQLLRLLPSLGSLQWLALGLPEVPARLRSRRRRQAAVTSALELALRSLTRLTGLQLSTYSYPPGLVDALGALTQLRSLALTAHEPGKALSPARIRWQSLQLLSELCLSDVLPGPGLEALPCLQHLRLEFSVDGVELPAEVFRLSSLTELRACGAELGRLEGPHNDSDDAAGLGLPSLQRLYLSGFDLGPSFAHLPLRQLTTLWLADMGCADQHGEHEDLQEEMARHLAPLSQCTSLRELGFRQSYVWLPASITALTTLTMLDFGEAYCDPNLPLPEGPYLAGLSHLNLGVFSPSADLEPGEADLAPDAPCFFPAVLARCTALRSLQLLRLKLPPGFGEEGWEVPGEAECEAYLPLRTAEVFLLSSLPHLRQLIIGRVPSSEAAAVELDAGTRDAISLLQDPLLPGLEVTWVAPEDAGDEA